METINKIFWMDKKDNKTERIDYLVAVSILQKYWPESNAERLIRKSSFLNKIETTFGYIWKSEEPV